MELLTAPVPLAKAAAESDPNLVEIRLNYGRPITLRLGARSYARDSVGKEDEPTLPAGISAAIGLCRSATDGRSGTAAAS